MGFEYYQDKRGQWRWRLRARNGKIVASGEGFASIRNVLRSIDAVLYAADDATTKRVEK